uniref:BTB domain-containing protein n=1 Tax=Globodera rostochiensis TaxID=31243 RepID=A0A914I8S5_GLORO
MGEEAECSSDENGDNGTDNYAFHREVPNGNVIIRRPPTRANRIARHYKSSSVLNCPYGPLALVGPSASTSCAAGTPFSVSTPAGHALPRLANALRSLISSASAKTSSKTAFVDAGDELIYYSNAMPSSKTTQIDGREGTECQRPNCANQRSPSLQSTNSSGRDDGKYFWHRQPTTLEQIKALYKSVPNFASLEEDAERRVEAKMESRVDRFCAALHRREGCAALLCPPMAPINNHPPPLQPQRKRLLFPAHPRQNSDRFSTGGTSGSSTASAICGAALLKRLANLDVMRHVRFEPRRRQKTSTSFSGSAKSDGAARVESCKKKSPTDSGYRSRGETPRREQQTAPKGRAEETAPKGRAEETAPKGRAEETAPKGRAEETAPKGRAEETAPKGRAEETAPKGRAEETAPKGRAEETAPKGRAEETAPKGRAEETAPKGRAEETAPKGRAEETAPKGRAEETAPKGRVEETAPKGRVEETAPKGRAEETAPKGRAEETAPKGRAEETAPKGRAEETAPKGRAEETAPKGRAEETAPKGRAEETAPKGRAEDLDILSGPAEFPRRSNREADPRAPRPLSLSFLLHQLPTIASPIGAASHCPSALSHQRHNPRNYVWTHPISAAQLLETVPIKIEETVLQSTDDSKSRQHKEKLEWTVGVLADLLVLMGLELRRLCAVLGKCTRRDVGIVVLLFLPTSLAWHTIHHAQQTIEHFVRSSTDQTKRWHSLSDRSRLKYLNGGLFLRWMIDCRIGAIVDEKVSLFLASIFDCLISQLVLQVAQLPSHSLSASELLSSLASSMPHSRNFHLLSPPFLPLSQLILAEDPSTESALFGTSVGEELAMDGEALLALHHFICSNCPQGEDTKTAPTLEEWLRKSTLYALQRRARTIRSWDILQASHLLLPGFDCPPPTASQMFADDYSWRLQFCTVTKAILLGAECDAQKLTSTAVPIDLKTFPDFAGWTPLCWALALDESQLVGLAIGQPTGRRAVRSEDKYIQIGASTGNVAICELLLRAGANPFKYVPLSVPSAFAIAASRGDQTMLGLFLPFCSVLRQQFEENKRDEEPNPSGGFTKDEEPNPSGGFAPSPPFQMDPRRFASLTELEKNAFSEAIYLAAETQRWEVAVKLREFGVGWPNVGCWMGALEWAMGGDYQQQQKLEQLLDEIRPTFAGDLIASGGEDAIGQQRHRLGRMDKLVDMLFRLLSSATPSSVRVGAARALSLLFAHLQRHSLVHLERELSAFFPPPASSACCPPTTTQIDPKFVDSPELSDIRFRFDDGQIVFGHRIVLVNVSEEFRQILKRPSGLLKVSECDASVFRLLLEFVYGNVAKCFAELHKIGVDKQFELIKSAKHFGVHKLAEKAQKVTGVAITVGNLFKMYTFAQALDCDTLVEECERFALGHLTELMAYGKCLGDGGKLAPEGRQKLLDGMKKQFGLVISESRI